MNILYAAQSLEKHLMDGNHPRDMRVRANVDRLPSFSGLRVGLNSSRLAGGNGLDMATWRDNLPEKWEGYNVTFEWIYDR